MARALLIVALVAVAFWVYTIVDCAVQHPTRHRGVSKPVWIVIVIVLPVLGGILWLTIGRGSNKRANTISAPDDDPTFLANLGSVADQDERIRRLEEELAQLDAEDDIWQRGSTAGEAGTSGTTAPETKGATPPAGETPGDGGDGDDTRGHRGAVG